MTQLLLYSKDVLLARGLESVLRDAGGFELLPLCTTLPALTGYMAIKAPDLILLDVGPEITFTVLNEIRRATSRKMILWVNSISTELACHAIGLGIQGILRKALPPALQLQCLQKVQAGEVWFEKALVDDFVSAPPVALTRREVRLITLLSQGLKNKEIAHSLTVTEASVKVYVSRLFRKTGAKDRLDLALVAFKSLSIGRPQVGAGGTTSRNGLVVRRAAEPVVTTELAAI